MFSKKKENSVDKNSNAPGKDQNKNISPNSDISAATSANKVLDDNQFSNGNDHLHDENTETFARNSIAENSTKTGGFSFVKKAKPKNETEDFNDIPNKQDHKSEKTTTINEEYNQHPNISINLPTKSENEAKFSKGGFKFIKKTFQATIDLNKSGNNQLNSNDGNESNISTSQVDMFNNTNNLNNNYNTFANAQNNKLTLDNLLSESENILNIIQKDIDDSYVSSKNNLNNLKKMTEIEQETNPTPIEGKNNKFIILSDNSNEQKNTNIFNKQNHIDDSSLNKSKEIKPKKVGGGFNFVKKKVETQQLHQQKQSQIEKESINIDIYNVNTFNDINSDTKSFRSLKINNNILQDNISVNLEDPFDSKSVKSNLPTNTNAKINSAQSLKNATNLKNSLTEQLPAKESNSTKLFSHKENVIENLRDENVKDKKHTQQNDVMKVKLNYI